MTMTEELARRILGRPRRKNLLTPTKQTELLMDWLEGKTYKVLGLKYHIGVSQVGTIIKRARSDAAKRLKGKGE